MNKNNNIFNYFKKITIQEMVIAALLFCFYIILRQPFLIIHLGIMQIGLSYIALILMGLLLRPILGIPIAFLGDLIGTVFSIYGIGSYYWTYAIIAPIIYIISFFLKNLYKINNFKIVLSLLPISTTIISFVLMIMFIVEADFIKLKGEIAIDFSKVSTKILVWIMFSFMILTKIIISFIYFKFKTNKIKDLIITIIIVEIIYILMIWIWGPIANILWLEAHGKYSNIKGHYFKLYNIYQIPRLLKTPLQLPIYVFIILTLKKIFKIIDKNSDQYRW